MNEGIREQLSTFSKRNSCGPIVFPSFYMPCFSIIRDKDARKRVFFCHKWENKQIKFLGKELDVQSEMLSIKAQV